MAEYKLIEGIIQNSIHYTWLEAKEEWSLHEVYIDEECDRCLCNKYPIKEICVLKNKINHKIVIVGNVCVKKFLGLPSDKIFRSIRNIRKNIEKSLSTYTLEYAYEKKWITEWEYNFSISIVRKRKLFPKQIEQRTIINKKVLSIIKRDYNLTTAI